jgi:hypothetical protein
MTLKGEQRKPLSNDKFRVYDLFDFKLNFAEEKKRAFSQKPAGFGDPNEMISFLYANNITMCCPSKLHMP